MVDISSKCQRPGRGEAWSSMGVNYLLVPHRFPDTEPEEATFNIQQDPGGSRDGAETEEISKL